MELSKLSTAELKSIVAQIHKEIEKRQKEEKAQLVKELEAKAATLGFTLAELVSGSSGKRASAPVAIKYRHPKKDELTWTGRGRQPKWVVEFLSQGGTIDLLQV